MFIFRKLLKFINWYSQVVHDMAAQQGPDTPLWMQWNEPDLKAFDNNVRELKARIRRTEGFFRLLKWKALRVYRHWVRFRVATIRLYRLSYSYVLNIFISLKTILLSIGWRVLVYTVESLFKIFYILVDQPAHFLYKNFLKYYVDKYYYPFFHPYLVRWYYRVKIRLYKMWYSDFVTRVILFIYKVYIYAGVPTVEYLDEELEVWTPEHKYYSHYRAEEALDMVIQSLDPDSDEIVEDYYEDIMEDVDADEYEFLSPWWYTSTFDSIFWCFLPGLLSFTNISLFEDRNHFFLTIDDLYFGHASNPLFTSDDIWKIWYLFSINVETFEAIDSKLFFSERRKSLSKFFGVNENSKFFNRVRSEFYKARKVKRPKPHFPNLEVFYGGWRDHTVTLPGMWYNWIQATKTFWAWKYIEFYFSRLGGFYYYEYLLHADLLSGYFQIISHVDGDFTEWVVKESRLWGKLITQMSVDNRQFGRVKGFKRKRWIEFALDVDYNIWYEDHFFERYLPAAKGFTDAYRQPIAGPWRELTRYISWNFPARSLRRQADGMLHKTYHDIWRVKWGKLTWAIAVDNYLWLWDEWSSKVGKKDNSWWYNERLLREFLLEGYEKRIIQYWLHLEKLRDEGRLPMYNEGRRRKEYKGRGEAEKRSALRLQIKRPVFSELDWRSFIDRPGYLVRNTIDKARRLGPSATMQKKLHEIFPYWKD